jgi:hypothetical protein
MSPIILTIINYSKIKIISTLNYSKNSCNTLITLHESLQYNNYLNILFKIYLSITKILEFTLLKSHLSQKILSSE